MCVSVSTCLYDGERQRVHKYLFNILNHQKSLTEIQFYILILIQLLQIMNFVVIVCRLTTPSW